MSRNDGLLWLTILIAIGLVLFCVAEFFQEHYVYFLRDNGDAQQFVRVNTRSGVPQFMMVDRRTMRWVYVDADPCAGVSPDSTKRFSPDWKVVP